MTLVEPIVGHLLSRYPETVLEGFSKIRNNVEADPSFGAQLVNDPQGLAALKASVLRKPFAAATLRIVTLIANKSFDAGEGNSMRSHLLREFLRGEAFNAVRQGMAAALTEENFEMTQATMALLQVAAKSIPLALMARFNHQLPLQANCFRVQLPYSHRRLTAIRLQFFMNLVTSKYNTHAGQTICAFGFLTHMLEDAASLLQEGTSQGLQLGKEALRTFDEYFMSSRQITAKEKKAVLGAQRNVLRLIVKALEFPPVADDASHLIYRTVVEMLESPADYSTVKDDAPEDRGMPNFMLFTLLRLLKPRRSALMSQIVVFILHKAPDLIRPYFTRLSGHLAEDDHSQQVAPSTARVAVLNIMTRVARAPIPYHLASRQVTLTNTAATSASAARMFYSMTPQDVVDEVCPAWLAEYAHSLINGSTNVLTLTLVMQMTAALLQRAAEVVACVQPIVQAQEQRLDASACLGAELPDWERDALVLRRACAADAEEEGESFMARVHGLLLSTLPRREEFWHRMTQQLQPMQEQLFRKPDAALRTKVEFVQQRMFALMQSYTAVFDLHQPWSSAVGNLLPRFTPGPRAITNVLLDPHADPLSGWEPVSVAALCHLLVASLERGVALTKIHHINMNNNGSGAGARIAEWPLLLSLLLWAAHRRAHRADDPLVARALLWIAKLLQWVVHSVTIHFSCQLSEAYLWVLSLSPETAPILLHLLNNILTRSLSKAADRVAREFLEGSAQYGLLVSTAEAFVSRSNDKQEQQQQQQQQGSTGKDSGSASAKGKGGKMGATESGSGSSKMELWNDHLSNNLGAFLEVLRSVKQAWSSRDQYLAAAAEDMAEGGADDGKRTITAQLILAPTQERAVLPPHEQLRHCLVGLHSPVSAVGHSEAETLEQLIDTAAATWSGEKKLQQAASDICACVGDDIAVLSSQSAVCWELGATLVRLLSTNSTNDVNHRVAVRIARHVLRLVEHQSPAELEGFAQKLSEERDTARLGFFFLLFACLHVLLRRAHTVNDRDDGDDNEEAQPNTWRGVEQLLRDTYTTGLGVADRLRYAGLLTLHYMDPNGSRTTEGNGGDVSGSSDSDHTASDDSSDESDDDNHNSDNGDAADDSADDEGGAAVEKRSAAAAPAISHRSQAAKSSSSPAVVLRGAVAPRALVEGRFLVWNHRGTTLTPEEDMLALLSDMWTEEDVIAKALQCPARMHNALRLSPTSSANTITTADHDAQDGVPSAIGMDLLMAVFPEVSEAADLAVLSLEACTHNALSDPRYLLPLLQSVCAIPHAMTRRKLLAVRCAPFLVRALSFTDATLRRLAAATLAQAHVPSGAIKVICGYARLKMCQLASKQRRHRQSSHGKTKTASSEVTFPRLPAPTSALLITALHTIRVYPEVLHNHILQFLCEPREALSDPFPFSHWLHAFPLECVSLPLMRQRQEQLTRSGGGGAAAASAAVVQSSVAEAAERMRRETPPQLHFAMQLVRYGCQTAGDWRALQERACLDSLMTLAGLLGSSEEMRLEIVQTLDAVVSASARVASSVAVYSHLMPWLLSFLLSLTHEYGATPHFFGGELFTTALRLLRKVSQALSGKHHHHHHGVVSTTQRQQFAAGAELVRAALGRVGATMRETLLLISECIDALSTEASLTAQSAKDAEAADVNESRQTGRKSARPTEPSSESTNNRRSSSNRKRQRVEA